MISPFLQFRADLDDYHDLKDQISKASRDIINLSKRTIFLLHQIAIDDKSAEFPTLRAAAAGRKKLEEIQHLYADLRSNVAGDNFWRYHRQISPGLQEYVEALSFTHYLEHGTLITLDQAQKTLCDINGKPYLPLPISDYLLGLSDLTGELMRFAISSISRRGGRSTVSKVCAFVRACEADLERMTPHVRELSKKQAVTAQSLEKIEAGAAYAIALRGSENTVLGDSRADIITPPASRLDISYHLGRRETINEVQGEMS